MAVMLRQDFFFDLPVELIAQAPVADRPASRLLCLNSTPGSFEDRIFGDLPQLLHPGDLLVFNDTRVIPARLHGHKESGGKVEVLIERIVNDQEALAMIRSSKTLQKGTRLTLGEQISAAVIGREGDLYRLHFDDARPLLLLLEEEGAIPLPPYITRLPGATDRARYQTVYARHPGAVAAPTAGLHFDEPLLQQLAKRGVGAAFVTLHVGAGTFQPLRVAEITSHKMHSEYIQVPADTVAKVEATRAAGGRVIAVGTTVVRALESAARPGELAAYAGETDIFIYPGYRFTTIDGLITNFHLPESTLLMLVCALGGQQQVMAAYHHAVAQRYRFFSYGDAMLLWSEPACFHTMG